jgi:Family of unknown function (DUF5999)
VLAALPVATLLQETFTAAARAQDAPLIVHDLVPLPPSDLNLLCNGVITFDDGGVISPAGEVIALAVGLAC